MFQNGKSDHYVNEREAMENVKLVNIAQLDRETDRQTNNEIDKDSDKFLEYNHVQYGEDGCLCNGDNDADDKPNDDNADDNQRETWSGNFEFLLSVIGYTVGLGNIWRFPYFVYRNGGGVALIPFLIFLVTCGGPLYYLEVCLGQFVGKSPVGAWEICPLFRGISITMVICSSAFVWYFGLSFGWALYFLVRSFYPVLGWSTCDNDWNTELCVDSQTNITEKRLRLNLTDNVTLLSSGAEFWENNVLAKSPGVEVPGSIQWHILGSVAMGWILVFLCLIKGVQSLGKVVYVTATLPYLLLTVLFIRAVTLDGAADGLHKYLYPDFSKLLHSKVWIESAVQCFFSLGPAWGGVITMASFNKFNHNILRDTIVVCIADGFTGFYSGLVVFSVMGFLAKETGVPLENLPFTGASLAFIAYPEALSRLPYPHIWSVLFFFTLVLVAIDTVFGTFETITCCLIDLRYNRLNKHKSIITVALIVLLIVLSTPLAMSFGFYLFMLVDWYVATFNIVFTALLEVIIVAWIYGGGNFSKDIELMIGKKPHLAVRIMWAFVIPMFIMAMLIVTIINYAPPNYGKGGYSFPTGAQVIGMLLEFCPLMCIFIVAGISLFLAHGSFKQRLSYLLQPSSKWKPNDKESQKTYKSRRLRNYGDGNVVQYVLTKVLGVK